MVPKAILEVVFGVVFNFVLILREDVDITDWVISGNLCEGKRSSFKRETSNMDEVSELSEISNTFTLGEVELGGTLGELDSKLRLQKSVLLLIVEK